MSNRHSFKLQLEGRIRSNCKDLVYQFHLPNTLHLLKGKVIKYCRTAPRRRQLELVLVVVLLYLQ